jgi:uncharacterized delta-60 repeat protein/CSLREA domain-containing protein
MFKAKPKMLITRSLIILLLVFTSRVNLAFQRPSIAYALAGAPGSLDDSFGGDGLVTTSINGSNTYGSALSVQLDEKIIVSGQKGNINGFGDFVLVRYNEDGSLDTTFDSDGIVTTDFGSSNDDKAMDVAIQNDGKIVAAGYSHDVNTANTFFALARYNPDSSLDASFGNNGKVVTDIQPGNDIATSAVLQPDGRIVVVGSTSAYSFAGFARLAVVRYMPDGSLDTSFGVNGVILMDVSQDSSKDYELGGTVFVQPDGRILVAVRSFAQSELVRFNSNGSLDKSFNTDGIVIIDVHSNNFSTLPAVLLSNGKILVAYNDNSVTLARFNNNGTLDLSFGSGGRIVTDFHYTVSDVAAQSNGKYVISGVVGDGGENNDIDFLINRYNEDGSLDKNFGMNGMAVTDFGQELDDHSTDIEIQANGKLVVAGFSYGTLGAPDTIEVARYIGDHVIYVNENASGVNNGTSWADAYTDLQSALTATSSGDEIWVAAGTYKPTTDTDRTKSFILERSVAMYGGFASTETSLTQRDPSANVTVLSGDIGIPDDNRDNSYHVIVSDAADNTVILDGFTITFGNANGSSPNDLGGGMYNTNSSPVLRNLIFRKNSADGGGGLYNSNSHPSMQDITFEDNIATAHGSGGGGMLNVESNPDLTDVLFNSNSSFCGGGGLMNIRSDPSLLEVMFTNNTASTGAGMSNGESSPALLHVTFADNSAVDRGGYYGCGTPIGGGMNNDSNSSPSLVDVTFSNNSADVGGGMANWQSNSSLEAVTFVGNSAQQGGGIFNDSNGLTLTNVTFNSNAAGAGGGMYDSGGAFLTRVIFAHNSAQQGGGIAFFNGQPSLTDVVFDGNTADRGGGIDYSAGSLSMMNVALKNNSATYGGGMYNWSGKVDLVNVTFSANSADQGGGIYNSFNSNANLKNVTLSGNQATTAGGGIYDYDCSYCVKPTITNSIIYGNVGGDLYDGSGRAVISNSIVQGGYPGSGNLNVDPKLAALGNHGGFTETMALLPGSPAINAGSDINCPPVDQRGVRRPQGPHCDMGAYEFVPAAPVALTVTKTADTNDGLCNVDCSLREAIVNSYDGDTIRFALNGTFLLASDLPVINKIITVDGSGKTVMLDGGGKYRLFKINETGDLTLQNLTLQNGHSADPCMSDVAQSCAGAIYNNGNLSVVNVTLQGNTADMGGAIYIESGTTSIENSTFTGNSAARLGGGILNWIGILDVVNSTFQGNSAAWDGGAIYNDISNVILKNNTFSNNSATWGGAVYNSAGNLAFVNNILANSISGGDCFNESPYAEISLNTNNLIETNAAAPNNCGTPALSIDPKLASLANNGGITQTMASASGSPVIDAGDDASCLPTDQRGVRRPYGSHCDIGAYERNGGSIPTKPTFADVPTSHPYYPDIEILYANGLTGGCSTSPLKFCPDQILNRGQAAVFMLRGNFGSSYLPPVATHIFKDDWTKGPWAEPWAEGMRREGLSAGCLTNPPKYCPWNQIPREQAVIFALRMKYGTNYTPPPATGTLFADMTNPGYYATSWAEQAYKDGLIPTCGISGGKPKICPRDLVSRGLAAYMIVRAKNLTMP